MIFYRHSQQSDDLADTSPAQPTATPTTRRQRPLLRQHLLQQLRADLHSERIVLLPVRLFIGLGWLRAGVEKLVDPGWLDGSSLAAFLHGQLASGQVVFPVYEQLISSAFLPHVQLLSWIVLFGQLLAGLAIMAGFLTNAALLGGLFMNLNFLLAGVPNPSAFYLVIQLALLLAHSGAVFGVDAWLGRSHRLGWLAARPPELPAKARHAPWPALLLLLLCAASAAGAASAITDFSPAGSVQDPAMILTILSSMAAGWAGLSVLRSLLAPPTRSMQNDRSSS